VGRHTDTQKDNWRSLNYYAATLAVMFLFPNSSGLHHPSKLCGSIMKPMMDAQNIPIHMEDYYCNPVEFPNPQL